MITLGENEKIYLAKRRHPLVFWLELAPLLIFFLIIVSLAIKIVFISSLSWPDWLIKFIPRLLEFNLRYFLFLLLSLLSLIFWIIIFIITADYYLDCWIVTNERTIHTELKGLFNRVFSTIPHDKIQDITVETRGILPTIFRYGDLHIETAGEFQEFVFRDIPDPYGTKDVIFKAREEFLKNLEKK